MDAHVWTTWDKRPCSLEVRACCVLGERGGEGEGEGEGEEEEGVGEEGEENCAERGFGAFLF